MTGNTQHFDALRMRHVLGHYPTGVVAVTASLDGEPVGMTVGSFTSVSLDPPLIGFFPDRSSTTFPSIARAGRFCVNVLASHQHELCRAFARRGEDRFRGVDWRPGPTGSPILEDVVAWIDCEIESITDAGDHQFVLGRVLELEVAGVRAPLMFFQGRYGRYEPLVAGIAAGSEDAHERQETGWRC